MCRTMLIATMTMAAVAAFASTVSEVRLDDPVDPSLLAALAGGPIGLQELGDGTALALLPDAAVRELVQQGVRLEVLSTLTRLGDAAEDKALQSRSGQNLTSFPINPANFSTITIAGGPAGAVVASVTARVRGDVAFADFCTFQLRDAVNTTYTFPTWFDEIAFDHTVTGISAFNGRPVNQTWALWGQGGNIAGERVTGWWLTVYFDVAPAEGEGEPPAEGEGEPIGPEGETGRPPYIVGAGYKRPGATLELKVIFPYAVPPVSYTWFKDHELLPGETASKYRASPVTYLDTGEYYCRVEDASKAVYETDPVQVTVTEELSSGRFVSWVSIVLLAGVGIGVLARRRAVPSP